MDEQKETRLYTLLEVHEKIAEDIGVNAVMGSDDTHQTGEREGLLRVEEMIEELVDENEKRTNATIHEPYGARSGGITDD